MRSGRWGDGGWFWPIVGWLAAGSIALGLYLRWTRPTSALVIGIVALTPLLVAPLLVLVFSAWRAWSRWLALVAIGATAAYLATFVSLGAVVGCGPETSEDQLVVYSHNVWFNRGDPVAVAGSIGASGADIVVLQEVWSGFMASLEADPSLADYRFRISEPSDGDTTGLAVWSKHPIGQATAPNLWGVPTVRTRIDGPYGSFALDAVHVTAPIAGGQIETWEAQLAGFAEFDTSGPALMVGDFNATMDHQQFRALVESGWTDVHESKGCGLDATWPTGRRTPTLLRLDHILTTDHFEVLAVDIGSGDGSDHRSVTAAVRLRP